MSRYGQPDLYIPAPAASAAGGRSLQRILVPVDSIGRADGALELAARFSANVDGQLRLVHVRVWDPPLPGGGGRFFWESSEQATEVLEKALTTVWAYGVPASGVIVDAVRNRAARAVAAEARSWGASVMVVARRPRTALGILLLGSMSDRLMQEAGCPVLIMQQDRHNARR